MDLRKLMKQAQEMQSKMLEEVSHLSVDASVGGGMVTVEMNGHKQLTQVKIDPEVLDPTDSSEIEDLVLAAVNEAARRIDEELKGKIGSMAPGIPGLP